MNRPRLFHVVPLAALAWAVGLAAAPASAAASGTFTPTGSMNVAHTQGKATLLPNGQVLIAGGEDANFNLLASAELYNPATGTFTPTGSMITPRVGQSATLLNNGQALMAGAGATPCC